MQACDCKIFIKAPIKHSYNLLKSVTQCSKQNVECSVFSLFFLKSFFSLRKLIIKCYIFERFVWTDTIWKMFQCHSDECKMYISFCKAKLYWEVIYCNHTAKNQLNIFPQNHSLVHHPQLLEEEQTNSPAVFVQSKKKKHGESEEF